MSPSSTTLEDVLASLLGLSSAPDTNEYHNHSNHSNHRNNYHHQGTKKL